MAKKKAAPDSHSQPSTSALIICRNKHWRYISSFHGPWLQLPPEVLESLAHSNYMSPRPHPIDPAVFYDLVKIRKAVDEATTLAVRAASGLTSAAMNSMDSSRNGMLGGAGAQALGLGYGAAGGGNAKLSKERKHRMRELATQKLSQAYHLDEIAASVATMQSASTLEDVAALVLGRSKEDWDARYVHFFHEKIPSRMMAQCTPLEPLGELIAERHADASVWRTRALTRIFKEDYVGAARDLTEALAVCRYGMAQHRAGKDQLVLMRTVREEAERRSAKDWREEVKIPEEDQPSSLEVQLLFHRAGIYSTIACQHINAALDGLREYEMAKAKAEAVNADAETVEISQLPAELREAQRIRLEARKTVKTNAKRALKDYMSFLSHFDYTPGLPPEVAEEFIRRVNNAANGAKVPRSYSQPRVSDVSDSPNGSTSPSSALVPHRKAHNENTLNNNTAWPSLPSPEVHQVSALFSPTPPANLPPYPPSTSTISTAPRRTSPPPEFVEQHPSAASAFADSHEAITYHPLLTDALHSLLLCHALVQTPPKELLRHAYNAARLARVCDGYPIFLAARSPARADWVEVLRRTGDWIGVGGVGRWEVLCRPAPLPGHGNAKTRGDRATNGAASSGGDLSKSGAGRAVGPRATAASTTSKEESEAVRRERQKNEAILEALADERVVDEESFQRAVRARQRRTLEDEEMAKEEAAAQTPGADAAGPPLAIDATSTAEAESPASTPVDTPTTSASETPLAQPVDVAPTSTPTASASAPAPPPPAPANPSSPDPEWKLTPSPSATKPAAGPIISSAAPNGSKPPPPPPPQPKRWAQDEAAKEYPISTDRAEAIARWVREAPLVVEGSGAGRKKKKSGKARAKTSGLGKEFGGLSVGTTEGDGEGGEEEVD